MSGKQCNFIAISGVIDVGNAPEDALLSLKLQIDPKLSDREQVRLVKNAIYLQEQLGLLEFEGRQVIVGFHWPEELKRPYRQALVEISKSKESGLH